MKSVSL